jgi:predicted CXXCH cytochrome family protein
MDNPILKTACLKPRQKKGEHVMKKSILVCIAIGLVLSFGTIVMAGTAPGTGIRQTSHDLSSGGKGGLWDGGTLADPTLDRVCIYCHTPHFAVDSTTALAAGNYLPLWNHELSAVTTYATYTNGVSPDDPSHKLNAVLSTQPGSVSKLCLSCHDGTIAVNSYGINGTTKPAVVGTKITGRFLLGTNLSNHHPIGFDYNAVAVLDDEIATSDSALGGANVYGLTIADLLWKGRMECSTCHDVHNTKNEGVKFTWVEDTQSALCLTCHKK